eukprot:COSAG04_NODE_5389_length_1633_cov_24.661669_2_plen_434_part_01
MSEAELRDKCWQANLDDQGEHSELVTRMIADYSQPPGDAEWVSGEGLSADEIRNETVLVRGHGVGKVTNIDQPWVGLNQHTFVSEGGRTATVALKCAENGQQGTDFKLKSQGRRQTLQKIALRKTAQGFGLNISDDGEVLTVNAEQAAMAGVQEGMKIYEANGQSVSTLDDIKRALGSVEQGESVQFMMRAKPQSTSDVDGGRRRTLQKIALRKTSQGFGLNISDDGEVLTVNAEQAAMAGVQEGMKIYEANGQSVSTLDDIKRALGSVEQGESVMFAMRPREKWPTPEPEPEPEPLAGADFSTSGNEWAPGAAFAGELEKRTVRVRGHGDGRIETVHKPLWGPKQYSVRFSDGGLQKLELASKDNSGRGTEFAVRRTAAENRQARADERATKLAQQLTHHIGDALTAKSMNLKDFFEQADTNGDGKLTVRELF